MSCDFIELHDHGVPLTMLSVVTLFHWTIATWYIPFVMRVHACYYTLLPLTNKSLGSELRFCVNLAKCETSQPEGKEEGQVGDKKKNKAAAWERLKITKMRPWRTRSTFTRRIMEARDVIERRSLNILYLYRPGRERDESGRKEGKKEKQKGEQTKQTKKTQQRAHRLV